MTTFALPVTLDRLWPRMAIVAQRPPDDSLDWIPRTLRAYDRASAAPLLFSGTLPVVCHEAAATPAALQLLRDCGFSPPDEIILYRDSAHMCELVAREARRGRRIGVAYTSRRLLAPAESYVNDPHLHAALNDKANLARLLPPEAAPRRRIVETAELPDVLRRGRARLPLVLKASTRLGSGAGCDVAICRSPDDLAPAHQRLARAEHVVVEEFEWGATASRICYGICFRGSFAAMVDRLRAFHARRALVPLLAFDLERTDPAERSPVCNVLAVGRSREAVGAVLAALGEAGFEGGGIAGREPERRAS